VTISKERLEQALALRMRLDSATNMLNASLLKVEENLRGLALGATARVPLPLCASLVWKKKGKDWGLFIERGRSTTRGPTMVPLLQSSRAERIAAANALPHLLEALIAQVNEESASVDHALGEIQNTFAVLEEAAK
jgi:hypothetical protein